MQVKGIEYATFGAYHSPPTRLGKIVVIEFMLEDIPSNGNL
jgi:hypothetical protein